MRRFLSTAGPAAQPRPPLPAGAPMAPPTPGSTPAAPPGVESAPRAARRTLPTVAWASQVLSGAEYRRPEACPPVPLARQGMIVVRLEVLSPGITLIPDHPAEQALRTGAPR